MRSERRFERTPKRNSRNEVFDVARAFAIAIAPRSPMYEFCTQSNARSINAPAWTASGALVARVCTCRSSDVKLAVALPSA